MATMISEVYDALRSAQGVSEEQARKAAEAISAYDRRFSEIDLKLEELRGSMKLMTWMLATLIAGVAALIIRVYA